MISHNQQAIVIAFDKKYENYAKILLFQLIRHTPNGIAIYLLTPSDEDFSQTLTEFSVFQRTITNIPIDFHDYIEILPVVSHFTLSMYSRLFIPTLLPEMIIQSFYIDIDVLIRGDISQLFDEQISASIGAVAANSDFPHLKTKVPIGNTFYSGMLIINHVRWREEDILEQCLEIVRTGNENLVYPDNDLLVLVMNRDELPDWQRIDLKYNYMSYLAKSTKTKIDQPLIVHFPGSNKPWNTPFGGRYAREWRAVARANKNVPRLKLNTYLFYFYEWLKSRFFRTVLPLYRKTRHHRFNILNQEKGV